MRTLPGSYISQQQIPANNQGKHLRKRATSGTSREFEPAAFRGGS
jgi:hypothetical protein